VALVLFVNVPIGAAVAPLAPRALPEVPGRPGRSGVYLVMLCLGTAMFGLFFWIGVRPVALAASAISAGGMF
jgi:tetrahydromethanopterin S-methyltransferase subunit B